MISNSVGTGGYGYSINYETFNKLTTYDNIDSILFNIDENGLNDVEKFIKNVYEKSKEKEEENQLGEKALYVNNFIDLRKINIQ